MADPEIEEIFDATDLQVEIELREDADEYLRKAQDSHMNPAVVANSLLFAQAVYLRQIADALQGLTTVLCDHKGKC